MIQNNQTYYLSYNHIGSLRAITNEDGTIVKEIEYSAYGEIVKDTNETLYPKGTSFRAHVNIGFAGGFYDSDTKLTRFGYRDYDAKVGKWSAKDPIGFGGGDINLYGYVLNDPVNGIDPLGLAGIGPKKWYPKLPTVIGGQGGNLNPNLPWQININPIQGYTKHGIHQAIGRNNGKGVNIKSMLNAVRNPKKVICQSHGRKKYKGENATVILNKNGDVITAYGKPRQ